MTSSGSDSVPSDEDREEPRAIAVTADDSVQRRMSPCEFGQGSIAMDVVRQEHAGSTQAR